MTRIKIPFWGSQARRRLWTVEGFLLTGFLTVGVNLAYLQILRHPGLLKRTENQVQRFDRGPAPRGTITDRNGQVLVESVRKAALCADPRLIEDAPGLSLRLSSILGLPSGELLEKLASKSRAFVWIDRSVSAEAAREALGIQSSGLFSLPDYRRFYRNGKLASPLLGLVGVDGHGLSGIERAFEGVLGGEGRVTRCRRDGRGRLIAERETPVQGRPVRLELTIDRRIQHIAEREIESALTRTHAKSGMAIVQDPRTGEILALASAPAPLLDSDRPPPLELLKIPAVAAVFEPGSTFKIVTAAAAIEEGILKPAELFNGENGKWRIHDRTIRDHKPQGLLTFSQVLEQSCNIATAKIALRLGQDKLFRYAQAFGFGARTDCGLPGETRGLLKPPREWSGVSCAMISFGQEIGATALQTINSYSAIAHGGVLMRPQLVRKLSRESGEVLWEVRPTEVRRAVSERTARELTAILVKAVEEGTGRPAKVEGYSVAGKTGTAQQTDPETGGYSLTRWVVSFCGFLPAEKPRLTILVVLDEPAGESWGSTHAAPVFRRIAQQAMPLLNVFPEPAPSGRRPA